MSEQRSRGDIESDIVTMTEKRTELEGEIIRKQGSLVAKTEQLVSVSEQVREQRALLASLFHDVAQQNARQLQSIPARDDMVERLHDKFLQKSKQLTTVLQAESHQKLEAQRQREVVERKKLRKMLKDVQDVYAEKEARFLQRIQSLESELARRCEEYLHANSLELQALPVISGYSNTTSGETTAALRRDLAQVVSSLKSRLVELQQERREKLTHLDLQFAIHERDTQIQLLVEQLRHPHGDHPEALHVSNSQYVTSVALLFSWRFIIFIITTVCFSSVQENRYSPFVWKLGILV
jgi:hypothetical protein